jgi:putative transposase
MPVHRQKKDTTPDTLGSTQEQTTPALPDQQTFQQYLRELARAALRVVLEGVMREELDALIGVGWGQNSSKRTGYRNGSYTRDLVTAAGRIEEIKVPRDREGQFHTQVFDRYSRYEPHIAEGLTQMFVAGTSTHKVGEVAQTLLGVAPSASTISRLNQTLTQQFDTWHQRPLQEHWRVLYLDGVHFSIRHGDKADSTIVLTALGVDPAGNKEVLYRVASYRWRIALCSSGRLAACRGDKLQRYDTTAYHTLSAPACRPAPRRVRGYGRPSASGHAG